jgi:spermidine synthase
LSKIRNLSINQLVSALFQETVFTVLWLSAVSVMVLLLLPARSESGQTTLFEKETTYQYLRVIEDTEKRERYLCNKDCDFIQGGISLSKPDTLMLDYMHSAMAGLAFLKAPPRWVLFIGMGIGAMPRYLLSRYPDVRMDIVEIDPDVPPVAKRFFYFPETPKMHIVIDDGARFVQKKRRKYDVIFLDACFGPDIPAQLTGMDFFQRIKARLTKNGVLVANLAPPVLNPQFKNLIHTFCMTFSMVEILSTNNPANVIVVAGRMPLEDTEMIAKTAKTITADRNFDFDLEPLSRQRFWHNPCPKSTPPPKSMTSYRRR